MAGWEAEDGPRGVVAARWDRRAGRVAVRLDNGIEIAVPGALVDGLDGAAPEDLEDIEIGGTGMSLYWPRLDADLYFPAILRGVAGSRHWMAGELGAAGGRARSPAKTAAARENARKRWRARRESGDG